MAVEFKLPDLGEGLHEGTLIEWLVKVGDVVAIDQPFARIETDKAVVDIPAPQAALVKQLHAEPGSVVQVGEVLITFEDELAASGESTSVVGQGPVEDDGDAGDDEHWESIATQSTAPLTVAPAGQVESAAYVGSTRVLATPHTRAMARRLGVDLRLVQATGRAGRITDEDVQRAATADAAPTRQVERITTPLAAVKSGSAKPGGAITSLAAPGGEERIPVTHLRRVIAEAMSLSKHTAAHVTHVDEADVTDLLAVYRRAKSRLERIDGPRLTVLPYFLKAVVSCLKKHPLLNAIYDVQRQEIVLKHYYNMGVAVDTDQGLLVPVIKDAHQKDLLCLATELDDLAARARVRRLAVDELKGATFTVSSLGSLGGTFATPIIHQPELAILGLHAIKERPAVVEGQVVARQLMYISLSYDHRIIDGAVAARFMADLMQLLQDPELLMLHL